MIEFEGISDYTIEIKDLINFKSDPITHGGLKVILQHKQRSSTAKILLQPHKFYGFILAQKPKHVRIPMLEGTVIHA